MEGLPKKKKKYYIYLIAVLTRVRVNCGHRLCNSTRVMHIIYDYIEIYIII